MVSVVSDGWWCAKHRPTLTSKLLLSMTRTSPLITWRMYFLWATQCTFDTSLRFLCSKPINDTNVTILRWPFWSREKRNFFTDTRLRSNQTNKRLKYHLVICWNTIQRMVRSMFPSKRARLVMVHSGSFTLRFLCVFDWRPHPHVSNDVILTSFQYHQTWRTRGSSLQRAGPCIHSMGISR